METLELLAKGNPFATEVALAGLVLTTVTNLLSHFYCSKRVECYKKNPHIQIEWNTRVSSSLFSAVIFPLSAYAIYQGYPAINEDILYSSVLSTVAISLSIGYFAGDFLMVAYAAPFGQMSNVFGTLLHHVVGGACFSIAAFQNCGHIFVLMFLITEVSNPFLNARWFMHQFKMETSPLYIANGALMTLVFFVARILMYPVCVYIVAKHIEAMYQTRGLMVAGMAGLGLCVAGVLNHYWFYLIVHGLIRAIKKAKSKTI